MIPKSAFLDRRRFLADSATGLGAVALTQLLSADGLLGGDGLVRESAPGKIPIRPDVNPANPHAAREPHFRPRAKQVLMIFCSGAISQIDTFDYKPELVRRHGQPLPGNEKLITFQGEQGRYRSG